LQSNLICYINSIFLKFVFKQYKQLFNNKLFNNKSLQQINNYNNKLRLKIN